MIGGPKTGVRVVVGKATGGRPAILMYLIAATCLLALRLEPSLARLGRGVRRDARIAAVHRLLVRLTSGMCPVVHRGVERLKRGLPSSK
jgi:hypothetical protein